MEWASGWSVDFVGVRRKRRLDGRGVADTVWSGGHGRTVLMKAVTYGSTIAPMYRIA